MGIFLVTGASGFVGKHLCKKLAASGHRIHAVTRRRSSYLEALGVSTWVSDLSNGAVLQEALKGVDRVIHCAGDPRFGNGSHYWPANVATTQRLIDAIRESSPSISRFVLVSTIGAVDRPHGDPCDRPLDEGSVPAPQSDYGRSKLEAERLVRQSGLPFTIVRPAMVVGDDMRIDSHFSVFARHAITASLLGRIAWPGRFSVVHVDDLAAALELVADKPEAHGKIFFCAGNPISLHEYFDICAPSRRRLPIEPAVRLLRSALRWAPFSVKAMLLPALTATDGPLRALGWKPAHSSSQALAGVVARESARVNPERDPGGQSVITGAASGLGRAVAEHLAPRRRTLLLIDRDRQGLTGLAARFQNCRTKIVDLSIDAEVDELLKSEEWLQYPVRELFACAGSGLRGTALDIPALHQKQMFMVNLISRFTIAHNAASSMVNAKFGRIVFISSSSAFQPLPFMASYAASNAALLLLGEGWSQELRGEGVHLMTVCPGGMRTNFQSRAGVKKVEGEQLMPPEQVVRAIMLGLARNRMTMIVSFRSFAMSLLVRLLPRKTSVRLWHRLMQKLR